MIKITLLSLALWVLNSCSSNESSSAINTDNVIEARITYVKEEKPQVFLRSLLYTPTELGGDSGEFEYEVFPDSVGSFVFQNIPEGEYLLEILSKVGDSTYSHQEAVQIPSSSPLISEDIILLPSGTVEVQFLESITASESMNNLYLGVSGSEMQIPLGQNTPSESFTIDDVSGSFQNLIESGKLTFYVLEIAYTDKQEAYVFRRHTPELGFIN